VEQRSHYVTQAVMTASPAHLVTMLYDRLLLATKRANDELQKPAETTDAEHCHNELLRAQRIIEELRFGLDDEAGGEVATSLRSIYDYCHQLLVTANTTKSPDGLDVVDQLIGDIREVWFEQVDRGSMIPVS